jgi:hypothetical protein
MFKDLVIVYRATKTIKYNAMQKRIIASWNNFPVCAKKKALRLQGFF